MKVFITFLLATMMAGSLFAQAYEGPFPEITNGYGAFGNHPIAEKKFDNTYLLEHELNPGDDGVELTIRYASDVEGPMPTVLFAAGYNQYTPTDFSKLLDFIASKGYCVVFTPYPTSQEHSSWENSLFHGMDQAIHENSGENEGDLNIIDKSRIGIFGHSLGGGDIFWLGHKFFKEAQYGSNAKFLFSVAGWIGFNLTEDILANYPSDCPLRVEIWEEDDHDSTIQPPAKPGGTSPRIQYYLLKKINIPASEKNYVKVFGGPDQDGYHYSTNHRLVTMEHYDALDFYAIFRPMDAMMDYTFGENPAAKDMALGFDTDMGPFPALDKNYDGDDGFVFAYEETTYDYPCDDDGNPFREQCPTAPLPIEMLAPLTVRLEEHQVFLSWSTATEHSNKGFEIERSDDGEHWDVIGWIDGKGNSAHKSTYRAVDESPLSGINYYRFKQIDFDEQFSFSNVVTIDVNYRNNQVRLSPNPAHNQITISLDSGQNMERLEIRTLTGKIVQVRSFPSPNIDITDLKSGAYQVSVQTKTGVVASLLIVE